MIVALAFMAGLPFCPPSREQGCNAPNSAHVFQPMMFGTGTICKIAPRQLADTASTYMCLSDGKSAPQLVRFPKATAAIGGTP